MNQHLDKTTKFEIPLTNECNLRCTFCTNSDEYQSNIQHIDPALAIKMIDKLLDMKPGVNIELGSLVGEPLLYNAESFKLILDHLYTKDVNILIYTSLYNTNADIINHLNEKVTLTVSIYGYDDESFKSRTGMKFKAVLNNLHRLAESPRSFHLVIKNRSGGNHVNLAPDLLSKIKKNIPLLHQYGEFDSEDFIWDDKLSDKQYTHMPERNGICEAAVTDAGFDFDGNFILCTWLDNNSITKVSHIDNPTKVIVEDYNKELQKQQFNMFNRKCAMCDTYISYEDREGETDEVKY